MECELLRCYRGQSLAKTQQVRLQAEGRSYDSLLACLFVDTGISGKVVYTGARFWALPSRNGDCLKVTFVWNVTNRGRVSHLVGQVILLRTLFQDFDGYDSIELRVRGAWACVKRFSTFNFVFMFQNLFTLLVYLYIYLF